MHQCDRCAVLSCDKNLERYPENCPMNDEAFFEEIFSKYMEEENRDFYINSSKTEAVGYGKWARLREVVEFCKSMNYKKIGLAFCKGLHKEARVVADVLRSHDFEVLSVICKTGGIPKERVGISKEHKICPEEFEPMCNPIAQAEIFNRNNTDFNVAVGLCVGHDSLFFKNSKALATTLVTKDRVLAHNPVGAIYCAETYYKNKL